MPKEQFPHLPKIKTTPERILEEEGIEKPEKKEPLTAEQIESRVNELMELSATRAEASKHLGEVWGGLTTAEREELKKKGEGMVAAHFEALRLDPNLVEFQEGVMKEYDDRIKELASHPDVLSKYKEKFEKQKQVLAQALSYEHLQKEREAVVAYEQKIRSLFEKVGRAPGPVERKKLSDLEKRIEELGKELGSFELNPETIDFLRRREIRRMQHDLERYNFAETESRTELIREVLPDLLQGAPVLFQGETGSGKSQLVKYIAGRYLNKELVPLSASEQSKESEFFGVRTLKGGETSFDYGKIPISMKEGRPLLLDEINLIPHEFAGVLNDIFQLRVGDIWIHPATKEKITIKEGFVIMATANLKSERYKGRYELDVATLRRFIGGAGAREIHYLDLGKKDKDGSFIAPETLKILSAVLADRRGDIRWSDQEAPQKLDELKRFAAACRKIQEDFTLSVREGAEETLTRGERLAFRELVITLKDQIEIMKSWKAGGFTEPLEKVVLREFFRKAEISGRAAKDRENMVRVFIANKFFKDTKPEEFKIQGLAAKTIRAWQGKE